MLDEARDAMKPRSNEKDRARGVPQCKPQQQQQQRKSAQRLKKKKSVLAATKLHQ